MMEPNPGPDEPRPAATLVIVRDGEAGPQVLLTVRPEHLRFMGGATVFPGGAVSPADRDPAWEEATSTPGSEAAARLGMDDPRAALAAYVAALREAYEEVGFTPEAPDGRPARRELAADPQLFLAGVRASGARLETDRLVPAGRWVTPLGSPVRFDTRFFVVAAPAGWEPSPDPAEVQSCRWETPAEALAALADGRAVMAPPTIEMLQRLEGYATADELLVGISTRGVSGAGNVLSVRLSPFVHVVLAPNPGVMTGPGTNTYIVGAPGRGGTAVIDPAVADEEYVSAVLDAAGEVSRILVTHRHEDHVGGVGAVARATGAAVGAWGSDPAGGVPVEGPLSDGERIRLGGVELEVIHSPGHSSDHLCFYFREAASLFAGDNVLGEGTAVIAPPDGDMTAFMRSLGRLEDLHVDRIYPGHFRPLDGGKAVLRDLIRHRLRRERLILDALGPEPRALDDVVRVAYGDTPVELHPVARLSAVAHLRKLAEEGKVIEMDDRWKMKD